ncbi:unnamed protein product [Clavelina lepadiformis]|uniref:Uncharacterized protein n=1 Tax=Clavelina lepadiformis TaxID=159417 RepID=A0ABP0GQE1_CLALP
MLTSWICCSVRNLASCIDNNVRFVPASSIGAIIQLRHRSETEHIRQVATELKRSGMDCNEDNWTCHKIRFLRNLLKETLCLQSSPPSLERSPHRNLISTSTTSIKADLTSNHVQAKHLTSNCDK